MKRTLWSLALIVLLFSTSSCATADWGQTSLQDWRRSYLPSRQG